MLRRANRFHGYNSLRAVYKFGKTSHGGDIAVRCMLNNKRADYRVAVVVAKKVHKSAVVRNRIRRRIFEQIRLLSTEISKPYDIVVTVHSERIMTMPSTELSGLIQKLLKSSHIL